MKKQTKTKTKTKIKKSDTSHLRKSKTDNFLENIRKNNSMVEYFTQLRVLNPAAQLQSSKDEPRREGGFVRLAHAREEFTAPVLSKGKSVLSQRLATRKAKAKSKAANLSATNSESSSRN